MFTQLPWPGLHTKGGKGSHQFTDSQAQHQAGGGRYILQEEVTVPPYLHPMVKGTVMITVTLTVLLTL